MENRKHILLHSCCGPCSTACIERLLPDYDVTVLYANSNITDPEEYEKRKLNQLTVIQRTNEKIKKGFFPEASLVNFLEGEYDPDLFYELVKGFEQEPEGGARCPICFRMRLKEAAKMAAIIGIPYFTTTLPVSPHKNFEQIAEIGREEGEAHGAEFVPFDFKKRDGFKRSIELSKEFDLYRQNYCGCSFSKR